MDIWSFRRASEWLFLAGTQLQKKFKSLKNIFKVYFVFKNLNFFSVFLKNIFKVYLFFEFEIFLVLAKPPFPFLHAEDVVLCHYGWHRPRKYGDQELNRSTGAFH